MAKSINSKKQGGATKFKKGVSGNPNGGKLHNPEVKAIKKLTAEQLADVGSLLVKKDMVNIRAIARAETGVSALSHWMARIIETGADAGSIGKLDAFMDRIVGPVKKDIGVTFNSPHEGKTVDQLEKEVQEIEAIKAIAIKKESNTKS